MRRQMTQVLFQAALSAIHPLLQKLPPFQKFIRGFVFLMTPAPCHQRNVNNPIRVPTHQRQANPLFKAVTPTPPINTALIKTQLSIHYRVIIWRTLTASLRNLPLCCKKMSPLLLL